MAKNGNGPTTPAPSKTQLNKGLKAAQKKADEAKKEAERLRMEKKAAKMKPKSEPVAVPDTTTARVKITQLNAEELDKYAEHGYTTFDGVKDEAAHQDPPPKLKGGWRCKWLFKQGMESLILLPESPRTTGIWNKGQIAMLSEKGLTETQARAFVKSKLAHKHMILDDAIRIKKNPALTKQYAAFHDYPHRGAWIAAWSVDDGWGAAQHESLIALLELFQDCDKKDKAKLLKESTVETEPNTMKEVMDQPLNSLDLVDAMVNDL